MKDDRLISIVCCIGISTTFTWVFVLFPNVDTSRFGDLFIQPISAWYIVSFSGLLPAAFLPFFSNRLVTRRSHLVIAGVGSICQVIGLISLLLAQMITACSFQLVLIGSIAIGFSLPLLWLIWGIYLRSLDVGNVEQIFILVFLLVAVFYFCISSLPIALASPTTLIMPFASFAALAVVIKTGLLGHKSVIVLNSQKHLPANLKKPFTFLFIRVATAYALVSGVWEILRVQSFVLSLKSDLIFTIGFFFSALILFLFTKYAKHVGFETSIQWIFPFMAVGLFLSTIGVPITLIVGYIVLVSVHACFEIMLRIQVITFSRNTTFNPIKIIGWGYTAIYLGVFVGLTLFNIFQVSVVSYYPQTIICVLTLLVVATTFLYGNYSVPKDNLKQSVRDISQMQGCSALSKRYGLTAREQEVLALLLEGRSHPYIRDELYISKSTVDTHVRHIYSKMGIKSKQQLIDLAHSA